MSAGLAVLVLRAIARLARVSAALYGVRKGSAVRDTGWKGVSFIGSAKRILHRCIREHGVVLTAEAQARLDALPEQFLDFVAAPDRFAAQWPEAA